jgi:ketosteroid isomerase-like protein
MKKPLLALALFSATALLSGCAGSGALTGDKLEAHLGEKLEMFAASFNSGSVDELMAMFVSEPEVIPNGRSMKGTENVRSVMQQSVAGTSDFSLAILERNEGDGTFEQRGRYLLDDGSGLGSGGTFTAVWTRNESGEWLISRLSWSED